jgi:hypothetical protein
MAKPARSTRASSRQPAEAEGAEAAAAQPQSTDWEGGILIVAAIVTLAAILFLDAATAKNLGAGVFF